MMHHLRLTAIIIIRSSFVRLFVWFSMHQHRGFYRRLHVLRFMSAERSTATHTLKTWKVSIYSKVCPKRTEMPLRCLRYCTASEGFHPSKDQSKKRQYKYFVASFATLLWPKRADRSVLCFSFFHSGHRINLVSVFRLKEPRIVSSRNRRWLALQLPCRPTTVSCFVASPHRWGDAAWRRPRRWFISFSAWVCGIRSNRLNCNRFTDALIPCSISLRIALNE